MERIDAGVRPKGGIGAGYTGRIFRQIQEMIDATGGEGGAFIRVLQKAQGLIGIFQHR